MIDVTDDQVVKGPGDRQHVAFVQVDIHHLPIHILQLAHLQIRISMMMVVVTKRRQPTPWVPV